VKLLEAALQPLVLPHPEGAGLCLDAGCRGAGQMAAEAGYEAHIRPRGEEKKEKEQNPQFRARRRVVEVCHSRMNRFRKLLVRYEKKVRNYQGLVEFVCAIIVWRNLIPVHPGLIPG
jgi:IS5 family transposase